MRAYHFTTAHFGKMALANKRLKISRMEELNDPYELLGADLSDDELRVAYVGMRDQLAVHRGMICLSRSCAQPIMWSHYADRHRGVCLGFDVSDEHAFAVLYAEQRASFVRDMIEAHDAEKHMSRVLGTKDAAWRYEDEVRIYCRLDERDGDHFFKDFDTHLALREVLVGVRCDIDLDEFRRLTHAIDPDVTVYATRLSDSAFEVLRS